MPDPRRLGFWSQALAILQLSVQSARNKIGGAKAARKGMRTATAYKHDRKPLVPILLTLMFFGIAANSAYQGIHGLAHYADEHWPAGSEDLEVLEVSSFEYSSLDGRNRAPNAFHRELKMNTSWRKVW